MFSTIGFNSAFGYIFFYLDHDTFKGGAKMGFAMIGGMSFGIGLECPIVKYIQGFIGIRWLIMLVNILQFASLMMA